VKRYWLHGRDAYGETERNGRKTRRGKTERKKRYKTGREKVRERRKER
jgi:hypothetical protein